MTVLKYTKKELASHIRVDASVDTVWTHIIRVQIAQFDDLLEESAKTSGI